MRPRVFPAEDASFTRTFFETFDASMRPRVFPAEDSSRLRLIAPSDAGFNEAAGIPRGRP